VRSELVLYTFGNASGLSRERGLEVIKPSDVPYERLKPAHVNGRQLEWEDCSGKLRPSSDLPTHRVLDNAFPEVGVVAHTHFRICHRLGAGTQAHSVFRDNACRLFPWSGSGVHRDATGEFFLRSTTRVAGSASCLVTGNKHLLFSVRARTTSIESLAIETGSCMAEKQ